MSYSDFHFIDWHCPNLLHCLSKGLNSQRKMEKIRSSSYVELFLSICAASLHNDLSLIAFQNHFQTGWREGMAARFALSFVTGVWEINVLIKRTLIEFFDRKLFISTHPHLFLDPRFVFLLPETQYVEGKKRTDTTGRQCSGVPWLNGRWQHKTDCQAQACVHFNASLDNSFPLWSEFTGSHK